MKCQMDPASRTERLLRLGILQEPLGYEDGANAFEYVGCNPVARSDPKGLTWQDASGSTEPWLGDLDSINRMLNGAGYGSKDLDNSPTGGLKNFSNLPEYAQYKGWVIDPKTVKFTVKKYEKSDDMKKAGLQLVFGVQGGTAKKDEFDLLPTMTAKTGLIFETYHLKVEGTASFEACKNDQKKTITGVPFKWNFPDHHIMDKAAVEAKIEELRKGLLPEAKKQYGNDATLDFERATIYKPN